jgi:hypothetical protein
MEIDIEKTNEMTLYAFGASEVIEYYGKIYYIIGEWEPHFLSYKEEYQDNMFLVDLSNGNLVLFHKNTKVRPVQAKLTCKIMH